ncbi:hypothetical protein D9M69_461740 [compost metagenome]
MSSFRVSSSSRISLRYTARSRSMPSRCQRRPASRVLAFCASLAVTTWPPVSSLKVGGSKLWLRLANSCTSSLRSWRRPIRAMRPM